MGARNLNLFDEKSHNELLTLISFNIHLNHPTIKFKGFNFHLRIIDSLFNA